MDNNLTLQDAIDRIKSALARECYDAARYHNDGRRDETVMLRTYLDRIEEFFNREPEA